MLDDLHDPPPTAANDEGGLRPPAEYGFWRKLWWWFDFLILVKIARLRFVAILLVIGLVITQWDWLLAYYEKWEKWFQPQQQTADSGQWEYFCPMHPSVVRDNNREKCPICFMPLSKRQTGSQQLEPLPAGVVSRVQLSPYRIVLAGVQTWKVEYEPLFKDISAIGYIEFNERAQRTVSARVKGRLDQLLVNETGSLVHSDDVLASIYSPDLYVAARELLSARKAGNQALVENVRRRLQLLGISNDQIEEIVNSTNPNTHFKIHSPISGHVIKKYVVEGQYVEEGMPLYDIVDLASVWIQAQIYEDDLAFLPVAHGDSLGELGFGPDVIAESRAFPGEQFQGKLTFIYPHVDQSTRTLTVRFEIPNPDHKLRPGSTATIKLKVAPKDIPSLAERATSSADHQRLSHGEVLAVPENSIIDTGNQTIVYRESEPGIYEGVQVQLGPRMIRADEVVFYPVLSGIQYGERVVTNGSFLVDAETRLNPAAGSIYFGGSGSSKSQPASVRPTTPANPDAKIKTHLAKLAPEDRALAESQKFCVVLSSSRLGSMGVPVKVLVNGTPVFICCAGCEDRALENPDEILQKSDELRTQHGVNPEERSPAATSGADEGAAE